MQDLPRLCAHGAQVLSGWPLELLTEVAAAPNHRVAERLVEASRSAIDGLPDDVREALLSELQDVIHELPDW